MTPSPSSRLTVDAPTGSDAAPHRRVPVPRWLLWTAVAVPLCVLPSATWRAVHVVEVVHDGPGPCDTPGLGSVLYMSSLSIVSVGLALLTLGLVRPWGEVFPRWIPGVGGRAVPVRLATTVATVGATCVALLVGYGGLNIVFGFVGPTRPLPPGCTQPGAEILIYYVPLVAWAPLLYVVTYHYYKRRIAGLGSASAAASIRRATSRAASRSSGHATIR